MRFQGDCIGDLVIGINHGILAGEMAAGIRETKRGDDAITLHFASKLLWYRLPLSGRGVKPDVSVTGHAMSMHQDGDTALMAFRIKVVESHHVHPVLVEVAGIVNPEGRGLTK